MAVEKIKVTSKQKEVYVLENGCVLKREWDSKTPKGRRMAGRWVLRDKNGEIIDFNESRNDLADRQHIVLYELGE